MSRDDIVRMAREAGFQTGAIHLPNGESPFIHSIGYDLTASLEQFASLVAAHEREECAKVCEVKRSLAATHGCAELVTECAAAIRARGTT